MINMTTTDAIQAIIKFKELILDYKNGYGDRSEINQNVAVIKKMLSISGIHKNISIAPPPMVGGPIMRNVEPLYIMFNASYGLKYDVLNAILIVWMKL